MVDQPKNPAAAKAQGPGAPPVVPPPPAKQYRVVKEFVTKGGARYLEGSVIDLSPEDIEAALKEGNVEEMPIEAAPGKAPGVTTTHSTAREHKA
jgi:hypothetical protein